MSWAAQLAMRWRMPAGRGYTNLTSRSADPAFGCRKRNGDQKYIYVLLTPAKPAALIVEIMRHFKATRCALPGCDRIIIHENGDEPIRKYCTSEHRVATRRVSLHDADARPIAKGRLGKPVEFGYKAQLADNSDGLVLDLVVLQGNPPDGPLLAPAITRIKALFGLPPTAVAADRGYGEATVEADLGQLGVSKIAIPRRGRPGPKRQQVESEKSFRDLVKWRTGAEGRISCLKRSWGYERTLLDGTVGTGTWCSWGMLAHNTAKIAVMFEKNNNPEPAERSPKGCSNKSPP